MGDTKTEPTTFFGLFNDGYKSSDDEGHSGTADTPEDSQAALEHSQQVDSEHSAHTVVFGWLDDAKEGEEE
jgi:hypothetical protein